MKLWDFLKHPFAQTPPEGVSPTVEWQVAGACNYDCSYCIQSRAHRKGAPNRETLSAIIDGFKSLPGEWEIKISGGEPFVFKDFLNFAIPELMARTRCTISVLTNFSASIEDLERFCQITGPRLRITSASFHSESVTLDAFLEKALKYKALRQKYCPNSSFVINSVLTVQSLKHQRQWQSDVEALGFRYYPQWLKIGAEPYVYSERERRLIEELHCDIEDPAEMNAVPCYKGRICQAGQWYFVVDQRGDAFRCRPARRVALHSENAPSNYRLGQMTQKTFRLGRAWRCPFEHCPCSVPANRGMIADVAPKDERPHSRTDAPIFQLTAMGLPIEGVLNWNLGDRCNLRCSYCTQSAKTDRTGTLTDPESALKSLDVLKGRWSVKLSGGEPFCQPAIFDVAKGLVQRGHLVGVQTNFTLPLEDYKRFIQICGDQLELMSLSLHLEHFAPEEFLNKIKALRPFLPQNTVLHSTLVAEPRRLKEIELTLRPLFASQGELLKLQPMKQNGHLVEYTPEERELLLRLMRDSGQARESSDFELSDPITACMQHHLCAAGKNYLIIKSDGKAYRCYPASRHGGPSASLGSLQTGLHLLAQPALCPYPFCSCSVPRERGMVI